MSQERFDWLNRWCENPDDDVIRTFGTESNVKEIYDACNELAKDPGNFVLNQFSEFGNHLGHYTVTGRALGHVFETVRSASGRDLRLAAFTSATGSAGTIAAGDRLKDEYGTKIVAVEALECPTMLENRYGEHNIQGIGDKHIPLIHNVMNTDVVCAISDAATDELDVVWNTDPGRSTCPARASTPASSARWRTSGSRPRATCSQRSRRRSCSTSARTMRSSRSRPTAGPCTRANAPRPSRPVTGASTATPTPPRRSDVTSRVHPPTT
ncbi:MAG: hypothetical protein R2697_06455 [Ilumatobacteraceae bacterium]